MTADTLSRAPGSESAEQETLMEAKTNAFVGALIDSIPATDTRLEEVRKKQYSDKICSQIMNFCKLDHWPETATILVCTPRFDSSARSAAVPESSGDTG